MKTDLTKETSFLLVLRLVCLEHITNYNLSLTSFLYTFKSINSTTQPAKPMLIQFLICYSDSLQNQEVLQWMKSWPKNSMYFYICISVCIQVLQCIFAININKYTGSWDILSNLMTLQMSGEINFMYTSFSMQGRHVFCCSHNSLF